MQLINLCKGYLDNAATSRFKPHSVIKAVQKELTNSANPGRGGHSHSIASAQKVEACRSRIAQLTGMPNVVFTKNCTEAINLALQGLGLSGEVITTVFEHNSVLRTLKSLELEGKISLRIIRPADCIVQSKDLLPYINGKTSLIAMQEMSNVSGARHNIEDICIMAKSKNVPVLLDCAQSMGHTNADYSNASFIAASGHKGLHAPQGTGFLAYKGATLNPLICGGTGTDSNSLIQPKRYPEGLESGTQNTCGIAGLYEGLQWTYDNKTKIASKINALSSLLLDGLASVNGIKILHKNNSGIVTFNIDKLTPDYIADVLDKDYGIAVRSGLHCAPLAHRYFGTEKLGAVRVSIGWGNTKSDIDTLLVALHKITNK